MNIVEQPESPRYEIILEGRLDSAWNDWFEGLRVSDLPGGQTCIRGPVADPAALRAILDRIFDLNLCLLSVRRLPPGDAAGS